MIELKFTDGCPNQCEFCYEPKEMKYYAPEIPKDKPIEIKDMNFMRNPHYRTILLELIKNRRKKYLVCGVDWRILDQETCNLLKQAHFQKIRWAWDFNLGQQRKHRKVYKMLRKAGFRKDQLMCFMIVNWKIPFVDCIKKAIALVSWNVEIGGCCYDGGFPKNFSDWLSPRFNDKRFWKYEQVIRFKKNMREWNNLTNFGIYPEFK